MSLELAYPLPRSLVFPSRRNAAVGPDNSRSWIAAALFLRSYTAMLFGVVVNRVLRTIMSYVMHPYRPRLTLRPWRFLVGYSAWSWLLSTAILLRDRSDTLILGRLSNTAAIWFYTVGAKIATLPTTESIEPLGRASFAWFAVARNIGMAANETFLRLTGHAALLALPAGFGLSLVASPLARLAFCPGSDGAVPVIQVLGIAGMLTVFGQLSLHLMTVRGLLGRLVGIAALGMALRIALLLALIRGLASPACRGPPPARSALSK